MARLWLRPHLEEGGATDRPGFATGTRRVFLLLTGGLNVVESQTTSFVSSSEGCWRLVAFSLTGHVAQLAWLMGRSSQLGSVSILPFAFSLKWQEVAADSITP